jgi:hypothetical protein
VIAIKSESVIGFAGIRTQMTSQELVHVSDGNFIVISIPPG